MIFPQELFFLWLIVAGLALALFFFTALAGRLWCGWACPQTVFTDVYAALARRIQGWTRAGAPRHVAPWRRVATHAAWIALSAIVGLHLVGYFRSPYDLLAALRCGSGPAPRWASGSPATALCYLDFATRPPDLLQVPVPLRALPERAARRRLAGGRLRHGARRAARQAARDRSRRLRRLRSLRRGLPDRASTSATASSSSASAAPSASTPATA